MIAISTYRLTVCLPGLFYGQEEDKD